VSFDANAAWLAGKRCAAARRRPRSQFCAVRVDSTLWLLTAESMSSQRTDALLPSGQLNLHVRCRLMEWYQREMPACDWAKLFLTSVFSGGAAIHQQCRGWRGVRRAR